MGQELKQTRIGVILYEEGGGLGIRGYTRTYEDIEDLEGYGF